MKRLLFILIFALYSAIAGSPPSNALTIMSNEPINPYLRLMDAVAMVESGMDDNAYNDLEGSVGRYQVRLIRLNDYNNETKSILAIKEMYDPIKASMVFLYYACKYRPDEIEKISRTWNGGGTGMKKHSTIAYYQKILLSL